MTGKYSARLLVWGDYACFTRPEMKVERVSYDIMTPSAARGVLEAIYWKPGVVWSIDWIHVLKRIRFDNVRRNEVGCVAPMGRIKRAMNDPHAQDVSISVDENRQQRATLVLVNVAYIIEAHLNIKKFRAVKDAAVKAISIFRRRASEGQCHHRPYLGSREFSANFLPVDKTEQDRLIRKGARQSMDLGWMLYEPGYEAKKNPRFFRARMDEGAVKVPSRNAMEVRS